MATSTLTVEFRNADELRQKVLELAGIFGGTQTVQTFPYTVDTSPDPVQMTFPGVLDSEPTSTQPPAKKRGPKAKHEAQVQTPKSDELPPEVEAANGAIDMAKALAPKMAEPHLAQEKEDVKIPTIADVKDALTLVAEIKGIEKGREILTKFGADRISSLEEKLYSQFITECIAQTSPK